MSAFWFYVFTLVFFFFDYFFFFRDRIVVLEIGCQ